VESARRVEQHPEVDVAALLQERDQHVAALDALEVGLLVVDRDLHVLLCNARFQQVFGLNPASLAADRPGGFEVLRADGSPWPLAERPLARAVGAGEHTAGELLGLRRGGRTVWTRVSARPLYRSGEDEPYAGLVTYTDVTDRLAAEEALRESEAHFRLLAENSTDVISRHRAGGRCTYVSPAVQDVLGRSTDDLLHRNPMYLIHPDDHAYVTVQHDAVRSDHEPRSFRFRMLHRDGRWLWCESVVRPVLGDDGALHEMQLSTRDVTARVEAEHRLARMALTDPLTGLANRAALTQQLDELLGEGQQVSLLFLDLDRFKVVNDSLGHSAGDELLRTVAGRLVGACRDGDVVARLGGDEFVVVAQGLDEEGAVGLADRIQQVLGGPVNVGGHELVLTASVGIVATPSGTTLEQDAETLLRDADVSMYRAKARGRARAVVWNAAFAAAADARLSLERDLRAGLERGEVVVHYQPQVELRTGRIPGVEALVRWQHPERGLLPPGAFLDVAEESGLVVELGRQVVRAATAQVAAWRRLPGYEDLRLSVNLSAQELVRPGRARELLTVLVEAGLPPAAVTVEVLESVLLDAEGDVATALASYRSTGVLLALDDFGTGSSSLLHLRHVPLGAVKLDRTFVAGLGSSVHDEAIVRAVRAVTADLGLACIAEGVEQEGQRAWLVEHGVEVAQGFLLARPLPADELTALLRGGAAAGTESP
jgi:diguanylate cyclase (GGDEF)-like protein/PAS domain S-box-containing protein